MKFIYFVILLALLSADFQSVSQSIPTVHTSLNRIQIYMNGNRDSFGGINELPPPFSYSFETDKQGLPMAIISETDSIAFVVPLNQSITFKLIRDQKRATIICTFTGLPKKAAFSKSYINAYQGKSIIEIPDVYELVNTLFALTNEGNSGKGFVKKDTHYYRQVMTYFHRYQKHHAVVCLDSLLKPGQYHSIKMNSYADVFAGNNLKQSDLFN